MKGTIRIATISSVPVKLHWSFVLLFVWVVFEGRRNGMNWEGVGWFAILMLSVFACVVLHELGHAFSAKRFGVQTKDIILSPIGGVARLDGLPEKPIHESVVAAAGPLVNLLIAGLFGGYGWFTSSIDFSELSSSKMIFGEPEHFVTLLLLMNIFLAVFNLIPAFPMDGGRIFRSLLSTQLGRRKATLVTTFMGQGLAIVLVGLAYYFLPSKMILYLVPLFILMGIFMIYMALQEYQMVKFEEILKEHSIAKLIRQPLNIFRKEDHLNLAVKALTNGLEKDFIVQNEDGSIAGVLAEETILKKVKEKRNPETILIAENISPITEVVYPHESLFDFYKKMANQDLLILPVFENEKFVGVVDIQQLNEFLKLHYD